MGGTENIMVDLFIRSVWITEIGSKVDCTIVYSDNELGTPPPSQDLAGGAWWVEEFLRGLESHHRVVARGHNKALQ
jgi:hypothetical protein